MAYPNIPKNLFLAPEDRSVKQVAFRPILKFSYDLYNLFMGLVSIDLPNKFVCNSICKYKSNMSGLELYKNKVIIELNGFSLLDNA